MISLTARKGLDYYGLMVSTLRNWRLALISAFVLATLPSWAQETPVHPDALASEPQLSAADQAAAMNAELFYELLLGEMSASQGDTTNGVALMLEAARQSQSEKLYQRAAEIAMQSRSGQRAFMVAHEWSQNFPQSRPANRFILQVLLMLNRTSESQDYLRREVAWTPAGSKSATYLAIAQLYSRATDKALAAAVVEQALQPDTDNPELAPAAWATIGHLRLNAQQKDLAMQALQRAHAAGPNSGATALLALELMESGNAAAEKYAQTYLDGAAAPSIRLAYARILMANNRLAEAQQQLTRLLNAHRNMTDAWMAQASLYAQQNQPDKAQQTLQQTEALLLQIPNEPQRDHALGQAYLLGARMALLQKDYTLAIEWLDRIPSGEQSLQVQSLKAHALAKQGRLSHGRALIRMVEANNEAQALQKRQAEVALLRDNHALQEAYLLQRTIYEEQPDNPDIAYETAILAERAGKVATMEKILRAIIQKRPHYHHALNALGYSYADRGVRLHEAKRLIETALQYAPDDPFITDSLGWVEFRLGNTAQALALLEKAYAVHNDVEIAAHLGEVLWSSGETARARAIWRQALERDANNETLRATLERLQVQP